MTDIVDRIFGLLQQEIPDLPLGPRIRAEQSIRWQLGGDFKIAKGVNGLSKTTRTFLVEHGLRHQKPMPELFKLGGSRRTTYRIMSSKLKG
jgi:hypothetical protein